MLVGVAAYYARVLVWTESLSSFVARCRARSLVTLQDIRLLNLNQMEALLWNDSSDPYRMQHFWIPWCGAKVVTCDPIFGHRGGWPFRNFYTPMWLSA